ncbi:hypothetical protein [Agriterribacter sp.]|uniref:hypothetical protein n=1 Tax=Agriterribacter sp. TaxID=2821509 RepID=UPI002BD62D6D|nr:hypothetical protein [Agriterribacter sp.]HRO45124.1 hypothetical protein [Agriterribacter sp.]HRQ15435.1 hypothetical protein [Agriterribacter sp.]
MEDEENATRGKDGNPLTAVSTFKMYRKLLRTRLDTDNEIKQTLLSNAYVWMDEVLPTIYKHINLATDTIFYIDTILSLSDTDQAKVVEIKKPPGKNN